MTYESRTRRLRNAMIATIVMLALMMWLLMAAHASVVVHGAGVHS